MNSFWAYTLARLGLFLGAFAVIWAVGRLFWAESTGNLLWTALLALVASSLGSLLLLRRLRADLARDLAGRADRIAQRYQAAKVKEDED